MTSAAGLARRARILELIVTGSSVNEAAKEVGVSRRHAYRLISDPEARAEIARAAHESARSAELVLQRGAEQAARSLVDMANGKAKATPARVGACKGVLEFVVEKAASNLNVTARQGEPSTAGNPDAARRRLEEMIAAAEAAATPIPAVVETAKQDEESGGTAERPAESGNDIRRLPALDAGALDERGQGMAKEAP